MEILKLEFAASLFHISFPLLHHMRFITLAFFVIVFFKIFYRICLPITQNYY